MNNHEIILLIGFIKLHFEVEISIEINQAIMISTLSVKADKYKI